MYKNYLLPYFTLQFLVRPTAQYQCSPALLLHNADCRSAISVGRLHCYIARPHRSNMLTRPGSCSRTCADLRRTRPCSSRELCLQQTHNAL